MRRIAAGIVKGALASGAGWRLSARFRAPGVIVLMYHRVNAGPGSAFAGVEVHHFRQQMQWLKRRVRVIRPEEVVDALHEGRRVRPAVLITFDDGYRDYHDRAYPVLAELRLPATVFVSTSFMDAGGTLWTDQVQILAERSSCRSLRLPWDDAAVYDLRDPAGRQHFVVTAKRHLKAVADDERRRLLGQLKATAGVVDTEASERQMLTWSELRAVAEWTTVGGHTHTHPILSRLSPEGAAREIRMCHERIAVEMGRPPRHFAYPNGRASDFNDHVRQAVVRQGFELAFSTMTGINGPDADRLALRRQPGDANSLGDFVRLLGRAEA